MQREPQNAKHKHATHTTKQSSQPSPQITTWLTVKAAPVWRWVKTKASEANLADWLMALFTCILAGSTILYTIYAGRQWQEMETGGTDTHDLAVAAKAQADAVAQANTNALNAERPWIGVALQATDLEPDKPTTVTLAFPNGGRRPAKIALTQYAWNPFVDFPTNPSYPPSQTIASTNVILPNMQSTVTFTIDKLTKAQMAAFMPPSTESLYIYANVEYSDIVTGANHWTHACWRYFHFEKGIKSGFYNCREYNSVDPQGAAKRPLK